MSCFNKPFRARLLGLHSLHPEFWAQGEASQSYKNQERFFNISLVVFVLQTFKSECNPEAIISGLFWVVFHGLLGLMYLNLYKFYQ